MKILITGGFGYIGSQLQRQLGLHDLVVFDNLYFDQGPLVSNINLAKFYKQDILNWSEDLIREIREAEVIIPLAALVGAPLCEKNPDLTYELNYKWYEKLLEIVRPEQLIIYPNSNSGYGTVEGICTEETPSNPLSLYGKTKQDAENLLISNHKNTIAFRLATVFGYSPRMRLDLLVNSMMYEAYTNKSINVYDGHLRRNYVHVLDVARAFERAVTHSSQMSGNIYNLGNDSVNMTKLELAKQIGRIFSVPVEEKESINDPDRRDYLVSSEKLTKTGYKTLFGLEWAGNELKKYFELLPRQNTYQLRNY